MKEYNYSVNAFGSYCPSASCAPDCIYDEKNMSHRASPALRTRKARQTVYTGTDIGALLFRDGLCYVDNGDFYVNGSRIVANLSAGKKTLVALGDTVLILPDKKTVSLSTHAVGQTDAVFTGSGIIFTPCDINGTERTGITRSVSAPQEPTAGMLWIDLSVDGGVLKRYDEPRGVWEEEAAYTKIAASQIHSGFKAGDGVVISGSVLTNLNGTKTLQAVSTGFVVVKGLCGEVTVQTSSLRVAREMPTLAFAVECGNRIWGCENGTKTKIYASCEGDVTNWTRADGLATDSITLSVGSPDAWTGASSLLGYPVFFKENRVCRVYGQNALTASVQEAYGIGVQNNCNGSLSLSDGKLIYKSPFGLAVYDGARPTVLATALPDLPCLSACGCTVGTQYYLALRDSDGTKLLVYDTLTKNWRCEDNLAAEQIETDGILPYFSAGNKIYKPSEGTEAFSWFFELGRCWLRQKTQLSRICIRATLANGGTLGVKIQRDSDSVPQVIGTATEQKTGNFVFPIRPKRCHAYSLRLEGTGDVTVYSVFLHGTRDGEDV